jgi:hypothetical protein
MNRILLGLFLTLFSYSTVSASQNSGNTNIQTSVERSLNQIEANIANNRLNTAQKREYLVNLTTIFGKIILQLRRDIAALDAIESSRDSVSQYPGCDVPDLVLSNGQTWAMCNV